MTSNLGRTQRLFEIWNTRDFEALTPLVTDDIEWVPATMSAVEGGSYRSVDQLRQFFSEWDRTWAIWEVEPTEVREIGDHVLVFAHVYAKGRGSEIELDQPVAYIFQFRDGLLAYGATFFDPTEAQRVLNERVGASKEMSQ